MSPNSNDKVDVFYMLLQNFHEVTSRYKLPTWIKSASMMYFNVRQPIIS